MSERKEIKWFFFKLTQTSAAVLFLLALTGIVMYTPSIYMRIVNIIVLIKEDLVSYFLEICIPAILGLITSVFMYLIFIYTIAKCYQFIS